MLPADVVDVVSTGRLIVGTGGENKANGSMEEVLVGDQVDAAVFSDSISDIFEEVEAKSIEIDLVAALDRLSVGVDKSSLA